MSRPVSGTSYTMGQTVYPESNIPQEWTGVFPDRTPFTKVSNKKPHFIYVWKTWGKYWQVADGPSSLLTIETDNMPLGSYTMDIVIYHCRGKDKFVPLGYASTQFSITDQIPFTVTLSQVGDINQGDQSFIQNRAVSFGINLHDPIHYLSGSDITFNWDFGDNSGTLISRETTVTHTYLTTGSFRPQVVLMATISTGCQLSPTPAATVVPPVPEKLLLVVPKTKTETVMELAHAFPMAGHLGGENTVLRIRDRFHWPGLDAEVKRFCRSCPMCQRTSPRRPPPSPLIPLPVIDVPFERIGMDLVGPLPKSARGHEHILVVLDYATRYPEAIPLRAANASKAAENVSLPPPNRRAR
ncbi:melanocyte protein PMEL-like [Sinocyclocheilus anshuiensis]|uniref:melanocyte protein PMEL-like n=1 Tax=Sinocyclocheilus anshuiensis TaxID=1608454 RepID=UPI0007B7CEFF|nr:PREDICTED: melanocyte protein PMEL-like [Sinocyclocheilus anshuiensis]